MLRSRNYIFYFTHNKRLVVAANVLKVLKVLHNSVEDSNMFLIKLREVSL